MSTTLTAPAATMHTTPHAEPMLRDDERQRCEVWTRVMGYHRPLASFNIGKQGEFAERTWYIDRPASGH